MFSTTTKPYLMALLVLLAAAACGADKSPASGAEPEAVTEPEAVAEAEPMAEPEPEAEPGPEAEPVAEPEPANGSDPEAEAAPDPAAAVEAAKGPASYEVLSKGEATFLIDAPLEKIKGRWTKFGGSLQVDPADPAATRGEVTMDLSDLKTYTFDDPGKNAKQGGHALNWMEVGPDVDPATRARYRQATFRIDAIEGVKSAGKATLLAVKGTLTLHGRTAAKTVQLKVTPEGPAGAPTALHIQTVRPMGVSMQGHDIKPRDLAGKFLAGALERIGQKIQDEAEVSIHVIARRK